MTQTSSFNIALNDKPKVRWHLEWVSADGQGQLDGGDYDLLDDAERTAREWAAGELLEMCVEDWLLDEHLAGEMRIRPVVGEVKTIPVRDIVGAEPSLPA